MKFSQNSFTVV